VLGQRSPSRTLCNVWRNGDQLDLVHFAPAHTDTDIYIHFQKANVLHVGDIWFNGIYPFIDEGTGGSIGGMIRAAEKALAVAGSDTKIIPGHGPLGSKADFRSIARCSRRFATRWPHSRQRRQ
jgi:cyclase